MTGLAEYMRGLVDGGPTQLGPPHADGHRRGAGQRHRRAERRLQRLAVPPDPGARRARHPALPGRVGRRGARVRRACRYPHHKAGTDKLGGGTRGRGSEPTAAPIWGIDQQEYLERCEPWPLNPQGELLLGVKLESPEGVANCDEILAVPGLGFAELGPGDLGLSLGYTTMPRHPYPPEMEEAREQGLRRLPQEQARLPRGRHAGQHRRQARRGRARDRRPQSRSGQGRPGAPEAHDAGLVTARLRISPIPSCSSSPASRAERNMRGHCPSSLGRHPTGRRQR